MFSGSWYFYQKVSQWVMVLYTHELHNRLHRNVLIFIQLTKLKEAHYSSDFTLCNTLVFDYNTGTPKIIIRSVKVIASAGKNSLIKYVKIYTACLILLSPFSSYYPPPSHHSVHFTSNNCPFFENQCFLISCWVCDYKKNF